jgi:hypothetical protein
MYNTLLLLHSWDRWIIVILGLILVGYAKLRWFTRRPWDPTGDKLSLFYMISADIQFLLGIVLYFISPFFKMLTTSGAAVMSDRVARYWAVEHVFGMLIAFALIHIGRVSVKKAAAEKKVFRAVMFYGFSLLIILLTMPWPFMAYARPLLRP